MVNVLKENKHTNHFSSQLREESHQDKGKVSRLDEKISKWMKLKNFINEIEIKKKQIKIMESEHFNNLDLKKQWLSITNRLNQVEESVSETVVKVEGILHSGLGRWFSG